MSELRPERNLSRLMRYPGRVGSRRLPDGRIVIDFFDTGGHRLVYTVLSRAEFAALSLPAEPAPSPPRPERAALGVYKGSAAPNVVRAFGTWLGRQPTHALDYLPFETWQNIENPAWFVEGWKGSGITVEYSIPMLPKGGASLAAGARGEYNGHFTLLAQNLAMAGAPDARLRLGWEFNGDWYPWSIKGGPAEFAEYWRRIVTTMRAVSSRFTFDWCANRGSSGTLDPARAWPGGEFVDYIGMDFYDQTWPYSPDANARFDMIVNQPHGLAWHRAFAKEKGKPVTFPEWAVAVRPDGHGGGDAPEFIERAHAWISESDCAWQMYFDFDDGELLHRLTRFPKAQARYRALFG